MISSNSNVILIDKDRLEKDMDCLLNAEEKIEQTLRRLKYQDNVKFGDIEMSLELIQEIIAYTKALKVRRDDKRKQALVTIKLKVDSVESNSENSINIIDRKRRGEKLQCQLYK